METARWRDTINLDDLWEGDMTSVTVDGETLTCAKHLWEFNAVTGCGINPDDAELTSYGCQVGDDGTIYVDIGR